MAIIYALFIFFFALLLLGLILTEIRMVKLERDVEAMQRRITYLLKEHSKKQLRY